MARGDSRKGGDGVIYIDFGSGFESQAEIQNEGERIIAELSSIVDFYMPGKVPLFDAQGNIVFPLRITEWTPEQTAIYDRVQRKIREYVQQKRFVIPERNRAH